MSGARDLLLHLAPRPIEVEFGDRPFVIPALDAVEWCALILDLDTYAIFPGLAGQEAVEAVEDALWNGQVTDEEVERLALEIIGVVADRPWWIPVRILSFCAPSWDRIHVNDARGKSFAGWLDELWSRIRAASDPKYLAGWVDEVEKAPAGWEVEPDFDDEERAFLAAMRTAM